MGHGKVLSISLEEQKSLSPICEVQPGKVGDGRNKQCKVKRRGGTKSYDSSDRAGSV